MPSSWTRFRAFLDPIARRFGYYTSYSLSSPEYVGTLTQSLADIHYYLEQNAYQPQRLSAAKRHPDHGRLHDLSMRYVPSTHPDAAFDTPLVEDFRPEECQFHVHAFRTSYGVEVFSHYEARPDLTQPTPSFERLRTHYRPSWDETYLRGITNLDI